MTSPRSLADVFDYSQPRIAVMLMWPGHKEDTVMKAVCTGRILHCIQSLLSEQWTSYWSFYVYYEHVFEVIPDQEECLFQRECTHDSMPVIREETGPLFITAQSAHLLR